MLLFLCGADMDPSTIRARHGAARFVDIAFCAGPLPGLVALDDLADEGIWGILVQLPATASAASAPRVTATRSDGEGAPATLATLAADVADAAAVAAAARYWELPPAYRRRVIDRAEAPGRARAP